MRQWLLGGILAECVEEAEAAYLPDSAEVAFHREGLFL